MRQKRYEKSSKAYDQSQIILQVRICMGSSEHNSAYISPPNRGIFYHVLSEYANLSCNFTNLVFATLSFLFSITVENSNASQQKNKI